MIVVYPMLTSPSVSPNALPGIIKAIEKYIIVYKADEVLRHASTTSAGKILKIGGAILGTALTAAAAAGGAAAATSIVKQLESVEFVDINDILTEYGKESGGDKAGNVTNIGSQINIKTGGGGSSRGATQLDFPKGDAVSLEPTWIKVSTEKTGLQVLGVKVVPFRIKSSESIVSLIQKDQTKKLLNYLVSKYMRLVTKVILRITPKIIGFRGNITGSAKRDVIYADTHYKSNLFICLSQLDLEEGVVEDQGKVRKLHKLGWASFVVANDVNRTATFCMRSMGGVCSVLPYNYLYAALGREQSKAYEDLEDLKRKSGPFFRMSTSRQKVFSSESDLTLIDIYLSSLEKENE